MNPNLTLLGQAISFAIFVWFCLKFVWPPVITALRQRQATIAEGLAAAERGAQAKELAEQRAKETLKEAKQQAADIIAQAQKRGNQMVEEAKATARSEGERIKQAAQAEIEQEINRAKEALRTQVGGIAIAGAERILKREIDAKAHQKVLDELVGQI